MDIPNIAPPGPGGRIVESMNAINSLRNANLLRRINAVKEQYAPLTMQAEAASKLAYANLMGPQFLSKLMGNEGALGNLSEEQKSNILNKVYNAGTGGGAASNVFSQMQQGTRGGNSLSNFLTDKIKGIFGGGEQRAANALLETPQTNAAPNQGWEPQTPSMQVPQGDMFPEVDQMVPDNNPPTADYQGQDVELPPLPSPQRGSYAENAGAYKGTVAQGQELGKLRAKEIDNIGQEQVALSNSAVPLDRMIGIIKDPAFQALRSDIPFFQDKQLKALSKIGTPEQQALIGDFMSTAQSLVGQTVNSFKGRAMQKEFDIAEKLKISDNDTIGVAEGKLRALKSLKEIAEAKNGVVLDLMTNHGMDIGQAISKANKTVNVQSIEKNIDELLEPRVKLIDGEGNSIYVTKAEAKRLVGGK